MTKENKSTIDQEKQNVRADIAQIIMSNYTIYIVKLAAFLVIVGFFFYDWVNTKLLSEKNIISSFTFVVTTLIDAIVLAKSVKVKGIIINRIFLCYIIGLALSAAVVFFILVKVLPIMFISIVFCGFADLCCCLSPVLELVYAVISHLQIERTNKYN